MQVRGPVSAEFIIITGVLFRVAPLDSEFRGRYMCQKALVLFLSLCVCFDELLLLFL